ncbi:sugar phosphate isomerase/epimerase family protein [Paenibacillus apiarius]|uniref:Sugar phosphate isomerase/epimerase n=1 Tax=Paenibacillus apiarius TaxID=46240 RepID=A0ABT4DUC8_9BACL|nr:sugar phosphate isomerase/epimerase family protein [Paenibacillus apiarius]MCY9514501.1 sugar phosphate isomerase/epimerase [Paenibacillus apiarius]MCY9520960.1 sugar phosphate isomerase/epimerase [Paenibacillus apiarius]MCY9551808.1 sugar phosphate isomerase/epimerase [Paenibacillus apiarius]MCY9557695.1 sugar phosphate isomerase/epimerase [Paenibacillus apiarius]MCY9684382.1 sugar phosphate isomerase/epimerase [Paenibacillus apiarius]
MKLGVSIYSLHAALHQKRMSVFEALEWLKEQGADHAEIVDLDFDMVNRPEFADQLREKAEQIGLELSNYCIGANFAGLNGEALQREIDRVKAHVDVANRLGVTRMRHDVASRPHGETGTAYFEQDFPQLVEACRQIADYAATYGIITSVENHGFYTQASERVKRLVLAVNRDNFRTTMDVGNFVCVDENPLIAVRNNIEAASMVHLKDFYIRPADRNPGQGWFKSLHGNYLRGAIVGQGDLPMYDIVRAVKAAGFDGYVSIEFEGMEDCLTGTKIAMDNARRIWDEV